MFTLKFITYHKDTGGEDRREELCISAPAYEKHEHASGNWTVVVHKTDDIRKSPGIEYEVGGSNEGAYFHCFVENDAGKTIDRFAGACC